MKKITFVSGFTGTGKGNLVSSIRHRYDLVLPSPTKRLLQLDRDLCPEGHSDVHGMAMWFTQQYTLDNLAKVMDLENCDILIERSPFDLLALHYCIMGHGWNETPYYEVDMCKIWDEFMKCVGPHKIEVQMLYNDGCISVLDRVKAEGGVGRDNIFVLNDPTFKYYFKLQDKFMQIVTYWLQQLNINFTVNHFNHPEYE